MLTASKDMLRDIHDSVSYQSFQLAAKILHHNRKRKCQGEQQEWPTSKHTCFKPISTSYAQNIETTSEPESVNDINSLPARSDSLGSSYIQTISDSETSNSYAYRNVMGENDSYDYAADDQLGYSNIEDHILEYEMHGKYGESECENDAMELSEDESQDIEYPFYSNYLKAIPDMFVLSSGRWVVKQDDVQSTARKPTIDQEFAQHFSTLMLW